MVMVNLEFAFVIKSSFDNNEPRALWPCNYLVEQVTVSHIHLTYQHVAKGPAMVSWLLVCYLLVVRVDTD